MGSKSVGVDADIVVRVSRGGMVGCSYSRALECGEAEAGVSRIAPALQSAAIRLVCTKVDEIAG